MKKAGSSATDLERIKRTTIVAMVSDDELLDQLVLKGGNAMDLIHGVSDRASVDLDYSVARDLDRETALPRIERSLKRAFLRQNLEAFDVRMTPRPGELHEDLSAFWGGYLVEFKLIQVERAESLGHEIEAMRKQAIQIGEGRRFTIDISRHEYVEPKQRAELDGYVFYVYSPEMIACEKLRAICQQLPAYAGVVKRTREWGTPRPRDFVDIEALVRRFDLALASDSARQLLREMFAIKRVPLGLLAQIEASRSFHAQGFRSVQDAMRPGTALRDFDFYFDFVLALCRRLEPLRDE